MLPKNVRFRFYLLRLMSTRYCKNLERAHKLFNCLQTDRCRNLIHINDFGPKIEMFSTVVRFSCLKVYICSRYILCSLWFQYKDSIFPGWNRNDSELPIPATKYWNWRKSFTTADIYRAEDELKSLIRWRFRNARSKYGFKIVGWNTKKTTKCQIPKIQRKKMEIRIPVLQRNQNEIPTITTPRRSNHFRMK